MNRCILVLPPPTGPWPDGNLRATIDLAFIDCIRTLNDPGIVARVLVPWTSATAPLVAVAIHESAESFDPEGTAVAKRGDGRVIPYLADELDGDSIGDDVFLRFAQLRPAEGRVLPLAEAVRAYGPTDVLAFDADELVATYFEGYVDQMKVLAFGSLMPEGYLERLPREFDNLVGVMDLEHRLRGTPWKDELPEWTSADESRLERWLPAGLLLQAELHRPEEAPKAPLVYA